MKKSLGAQAIPFPAPVWVVGSYDAGGRPNVMPVSFTGICCAKPPCVAVSLQKSRHSHDNITARQAFTINVPSEQHIVATDYFGLVSGREQDKLGRAGLTAVASELVDAPVVEEFPVVMECKVLHTTEIGSHTQFVGEILDVKIEESVLGLDGLPDPDRLELFVFLDDYHRVGKYVGQAYSLGKEMTT